MKRFLCILVALAMIFSFASCQKFGESGSDNTTTTAKPPKVKDITKTEKFKDANGRVVFTVEVTYPKISRNAEKQTLEYVNRVVAEVFEDACKFAESNINNASKFMDSFGTDVPWSKEITFESTYLSGRYVCFLMKDVFKNLGDAEVEPTFSTLCFDLVEGLPCDTMYFSSDPNQDKYSAEDALLPMVSNRALYDFYPSGIGLANKQLELLHDAFDIEKFYITEEGMGFYFDRYLLDDTMTGSYRCVIPWSELDGIFTHPEAVK